jgi:transaldolase
MNQAGTLQIPFRPELADNGEEGCRGGNMSKNLLEQLRGMTTVVADTGDIDAIEKVKPQDATTNPSLITTAAQMPQYAPIVDGVLADAKKRLGEDASDQDVAKEAFKHLAIAFGKKILAIIPGRVSTEVDARLSYDTEKTLTQARAIIALYAEQGIPKERILIKIASTWEGIRAAEVLEKEGIHCNLTLLFGIHQAIACAEANVTLVSPFVGRILDWYKKDTGKDYQGADDPGVQSVTKVYNYFKKFNYKTQVMGASFRNIGEIRELAGCDLLTISPALLHELESMQEELPRKLDPEKAKSLDIEKLHIDKATFDKMHAADRMAHDKLKEGIEGFSKALETLEQLLAKRVAELSAKEPKTVGAR